jgi:DNA polymerase-3 subunit gamma/tau
MSYQVLARKYRPQTFAEVVSQEHVTTTLANALASGRLHHAYLFTGARGIGKTTVARILAKALNCTQRQGSEPCNQCTPCVEITEGNSLDVQEIDGASNTSVDDVREIRERVKYMPSSGRYKIYIIDEVHMLSNSAFNALLKTLEEPPAHVIFIFATTEPHKIPPTILSRCQRYDFRRIPPHQIASTLSRIAKEEGTDIDEDAIRLISWEATGSLRDAESLFDQAMAFSGGKVTADAIKSMLGFLDQNSLFDLAEALIAGDSKRALKILDEVFRTGADLVRFAMDVLRILRHMLVLSECNDDRAVGDLLPHEIERLKELVEKAPASTIHQMFSSWYGVAESIGRSPFPKMLLEVGLVRLCRVGTLRPIEEVLARLDAMSGDTPVESARRDLEAQVREVKGGDAPKQAGAEEVESPVPTAVEHEGRAAAGDPPPTFEPVPDPTSAANEERWQEFMRWLVVKRPQVASIFQSGSFEGIDGKVVKLAFDNPLYADMLAENERRRQAESLLREFFNRPLRLEVARVGNAPAPAARSSQKKEAMREALGSDIVRKAADILNAKLHEVKVEGKK